jgi:MFS family permease
MMNFVGVIAMVGVSYYAKAALNANLMQLALIIVIGNIVYVLCCPVLGALSDRFGRRPFIVASTLVFAAAYFGAYLSGAVWQLYVVSAFSGVGHALFWPAVEAELASEADSQQLRQRVGRFNVSWSLGDIPGALVAGLVFDAGPRLPFLICVVGGVAISAVTALTRLAPATAESRIRHQKTIDGHVLPRNHTTFWTLALVANFFSAGIISIVRRLFPDLAIDVLRYSGRQWGPLTMMVAVSRTVTFAILQRHHGWLYRPRRFFAVQLLFPVGCLMMVFARSYWVFVLAFTLIGVACGVVYFSSLYYSVHGASRQAHRAGLHESILGLGAGLIPFVAGPTRSLAEPYWQNAIRAPYLFGAGLFIVAIVAQLVIYRWSLARGRNEAPA